MSIGALLPNIRNIRICMGKKPIISVSYENERISIKNSLPYSKCVLRLSCVVHGQIYGRFMGFDVNGFLSLYRLGKPLCRNSAEVAKKKESLQILDLQRLASLTGGGVLTIRGGSARKGYLFQASGIWKGRNFTSYSIWKGGKSVVWVSKRAQKG